MLYLTCRFHHPSIRRVCRDPDGQEDVLVIDLLSLKDGLLLPRSLSAILCGPFGSPDVLKLGKVVRSASLDPGDDLMEKKISNLL